ncbi:hypothetical protein [uncultured Salinisphaera sp.]|uniref:hypothetical protein n=1 Tax=uncultured Salinisphaera sp. TaxID=359372 RepID=UPI0032B11456|tara:strand:+ start:661 stop:1233 length:573 start_codon:yes stop_codon:yes gene_type:complete
MSKGKHCPGGYGRDKTRKQFEHWRERLRDSEDYPVLDGLETAWQELSDLYDFPWTDEKTRESFYDSESPITAIIYAVEMGFYPPPEVMLALLSRWDEYMRSVGEKDLETAMIGPLRRRTGNYARREIKGMQPYAWAGEIARAVEKEDISRIQAATDLVERWNLQIDPESVLRMVRDTPFQKLRLQKKRTE